MDSILYTVCLDLNITIMDNMYKLGSMLKLSPERLAASYLHVTNKINLIMSLFSRLFSSLNSAQFQILSFTKQVQLPCWNTLHTFNDRQTQNEACQNHHGEAPNCSNNHQLCFGQNKPIIHWVRWENILDLHHFSSHSPSWTVCHYAAALTCSSEASH